MSQSILNIINQVLAYSDSFVTDNPHQRAFDHIRRIHSIPVSNPKSDSRQIAPGASYTLFNGTVPTSLGASTISLSLIVPASSIYRLAVTAGPSGFRTARATSGIAACQVTVNNSVIAVFDYSGATLAAVQAGDMMRINGASQYDSGPYAFNDLNSGLWVVLAVAGTQVSCVRESGQPFSGATESVAVATADVQFYSASGIQKGNKFSVTGTLSPVSQKTFEVLAVTANTVDFVSASPLPVESGLAYVPGSITFYSESKKLVYIEVDQDSVVRFDADASNNNRVSPIQPGTPDLVGFVNKWGDSYQCTVVNRSVNPLNIKYFTCE